MKYAQEDYKEFLETEYDAQMRAFDKLIAIKAAVLKERGDVFVARFIKFDQQEISIFKVRVADNMPRKNSYWTASVLSGEMGSHKNWGDLSWADLREKYQSAFSNSYCVWLSKSDEDQFCYIGIKGLSLQFSNVLEGGRTVVAFGPNTPPTKYLLNLLEICKEHNSTTKGMLEYSQCDSSLWFPKIMPSTEDLNAVISTELEKTDCVAIQGPPGTGKTYRMASLAAQLLKQNKSVLATALTNRALMELASKTDLLTFLTEGKINKTCLTRDEHKELPRLLSNDDNLCNAASGFLSLATFYFSSGWAKECREDIPFDYVIMDEASQALFPMIAAVKKLGKKVIWIGDQAQLAPIVSTNEDVISDRGWSGIVCGFETLCDNFTMPSYMLSDTFRLTARGARQTGVFYNGNLKSVSKTQKIETKVAEINPEGGASFVGMDLKRGDKAPLEALNRIFEIAQGILVGNPKAEIAILSKFIDTTKAIQKHFVMHLRSEEVPKNLIIETVDKVQGLTVDYTLFFIPKASIEYSVEKELFNVATSRARFCTIIISDKNLLRENMPQQVRRFLLQTEEDKLVAFYETQSPQKISVGQYTFTKVGKVNLPQKHYKEIVEDKENIFVIDTNVFIDCPTIISKIGKYKVVIPTTVLEELDRLKLRHGVNKKALSDAAKNIDEAFQKKYSQLESGDPSSLPEGFDVKNADCRILSVALKYKAEGKNAILLTSDKIFQARASGLELTTISLSDFLRERRN